MIKVKNIIIFICMLSSQVNSQANNLTILTNKLNNKIKIGMSINDVKTKLSLPKAIESGFPDSDDLIINEFPKIVGQLNYTTWFYFYDQINQESIIDSGNVYKINGKRVSEDIYKDYENLNIVYLIDDEIIPLGMVDGYKITRNPKLKSYPIDNNMKEIKFQKSSKIVSVYIPILCVLFDKGTQVVAGTKVYFKLVSESDQNN